MSTYGEEDGRIHIDSIGQKAIVGAITLGVLALMIFEVSTPEVVFLIALVGVMLTEILTLPQVLAGFSNESMITIGALFIVVGVVEKSHVVDYFARKAFGSRGSARIGGLRLMISSFAFSSIFNNTPLVALMIPVVRDWARVNGIPSSQLLMPLSFSVLGGGLLTMIGTSTSLTVQGLMQEDRGYQFNFFAPGAIALPCGALLVAYMVFAAPYLLPKNSSGLIREARDKAKEMVAEIQLSSDSIFVGKELGQMMDDIGVSHTSIIKIRRPVRKQFLEHPYEAQDAVVTKLVDNAAKPDDIALDGIELADSNNGTPKITVKKYNSSHRVTDNKYLERTRDLWGSTPTPPAPDTEELSGDCMDLITPSLHEVLHEGDTVFIASAQEVIVKLFKAIGSERKGIQILDSNVMDLPGFGSELVEVVISNENPFIGRFLGSCTEEFAAKYALGVVSTRARQSGSDPENANFRDSKTHMISAGDVVLCVCKTADIAELKQSHDFLVVTVVGSIPNPISFRSLIPFVIFVCALALVAAELISMCAASLAMAALFFVGGWVKGKEIPKLLDVRLLMLMGCSISFAKAVDTSGLAQTVASVIKSANGGNLGSLFLVYFITALLTTLISNNAAAAIMYPISVALADEIGASYKPFAMVIVIGATAVFMSPIGYQTHVMVWGVGGYKYMDFVKFGVIPNIIYMLGTCLIAPLLFPF